MKKTSTTNILAKIFKKTPEKKVKKKTKPKVAKKSTPPKAKVVKKNIPVKKTKTKKVTATKIKKNLKTVSKKAAPEKVEIKTDNLRISKSNEVKPEIKKVKKQETEKREYKVKDYVVYPKHGVGQITEFKKINIGGIDVETYVLKFEKDKANGMVPVNKQSHLRPLATINQVNKCISILKSKPKIKRSMWSRRAQEYEAKISSGKIYELAEVVRDLNKGDDLMVDQSYSERQLFEKAYERILSEFQIVMGVSLEDTQKKLDKALKRNLEGQPKTIAAPTKIKDPAADPDADSVQITDTENLTSGDQLQAVERVLKRTRGIASYEIISEKKLIGLLEPWLGTGNVTADLPIPVMIDVILNPEKRFNEKGLRIELSAVAPGAKLDTHGRWRQNLERGLQTMRILAGLILMLVTIATATVIIFATRAGLGTNKETVEVLHLIGAHDKFISRQFERQFLTLSLLSCIIGYGAAAGIFHMLFILMTDMEDMQFYLLLLGVPFLSILMTWLIIRNFVIRTLAKAL